MPSLQPVFSIVLAGVLCLGLPLMGLRAHERLAERVEREPRARFRFYLMNSAMQWLLAVLAWLAFERSSAGLFTAHLSFAAESWSWIFWPVLVSSVLVLVMPMVTGRVRAQARLGLESTMGPMVPERRADRWGFAVLAVSAGTCEEVTYRGFLLTAIACVLPTWPAFPVIAIGAVIFGLAHVFQGVTGLIATTALGLLFGLLFVLSGSIAVPMAFHVLVDLRVLLLTGPVAEQPRPA